VSLHRVDARFVLPEPIKTAFVVGDRGWRDGLAAAGVEVVADPSGTDLVVASSRDIHMALAMGSPAVIVEGRDSAARMRHAGYAPTRVLPLPGVETPTLLLPLDQPNAAAYAIEYWTSPSSIAKRARKRLVKSLVQYRALPPLRPQITIGLRQPNALPFVIGRARALGLPDELEWFLVSRPEYELGRGLFVVFLRGAPTPSWVVKFARVPGYAAPFDSDDRGLRLAQDAPNAVSAHAPRPIGRVEVAGLHASVETAAPGRRMDAVLIGRTSRSSKLHLIERVAEWAMKMGTATLTTPAQAAAERSRLADEVMPPWRDRGVPADLTARLSDVPAVLQHNDLGCWNIVVDGNSFTVVDWESATRHGLPLWDLWYFLVDALADLDRALTHPDRERHFVQLFRGELPTSTVLFSWTRRTVEASAIPAQAVGPLATLCWLHHAQSHMRNVARVEEHVPHAVAPEWLPVRLPELWLGEPGLGSSWSAWSA
jgi:Phosphotransferase enzyme family